MEDEHAHGGGNSRKSRGGKKSTSAAKSEVTKKATVRLTESDPDYPKDIPKGLHPEQFWREELRAVMDQGIRRICWTVASTRSLSARLCIEEKVGSLKYFSLLHLLVGLFDKTKEKGELRNLAHLKKFLEEHGAVLEKDCTCVNPFAEMKRRKRNDKSKITKPVLCTHKHEPKNVFRVKELIVNYNVVEKDLISLLNKGPVAISVVFQIEFAKFKGDGIYEGPRQENSDEDIDYHMILCTGYGTLHGVHYWEVQRKAIVD